MAAEISPRPASRPAAARRFNEAAANGRGNLDYACPDCLTRLASMRPRRMAAEMLSADYIKDIPARLQ